MGGRLVFAAFVAFLFFTFPVPGDSQSSDAQKFVTALFKNLTSSQIQSYLLHVASWDDLMANAVYYLTQLQTSAALCVVDEISTIFSYIMSNLNDPLGVVYVVLDTCNNNQTTGALGNMLMPFTANDSITIMSPIVTSLVKPFPLQFRAALTYAIEAIEINAAAGYNYSFSAEDIVSLKQIIGKLNSNPKQYDQIVELFPSSIDLFTGTYNSAYLTVIDHLGAFVDNVELINQTTADEINTAIASLYAYAYPNLMEYVSYVLNWIMKKNITTKVSGNSTLTNAVSTFASTISLLMGFAETTVEDTIDEYMEAPYTVNATTT